MVLRVEQNFTKPFAKSEKVRIMRLSFAGDGEAAGMARRIPTETETDGLTNG